MGQYNIRQGSWILQAGGGALTPLGTGPYPPPQGTGPCPPPQAQLGVIDNHHTLVAVAASSPPPPRS